MLRGVLGHLGPVSRSLIGTTLASRLLSALRPVQKYPVSVQWNRFLAGTAILRSARTAPETSVPPFGGRLRAVCRKTVEPFAIQTSLRRGRC
jgi:hypothetical protein